MEESDAARSAPGVGRESGGDEWSEKPLSIRGDNGLEYLSSMLMISAERPGIALTYIKPSKPQQNTYIERYSWTVRDVWLDLHIFETNKEQQQIATEWLWTYNNERTNMGIRGDNAHNEAENVRVSSTTAPR